MHLRTYFCFLLALILSGCGHLPYISQSDLKPADQRPAVELVQEVSFPARLGRNNWILGLAAGTYMPVLEDEQGIYYKGPADCVLLSDPNSARLIDTRDGGIWLPKKTTVDAPPKIYSYEFTGKIHRTINAARQSAPGGSVAAITVNQSILNTPKGTSPMASGVASGVVSALIGSIIEANQDSNRMVLMTDAVPREVLLDALKKAD